jgi:putative glycosyltransferase (TIGR04348 family)
MKIFMVCPAPPQSLKGNRVTATRWAGILKSLGHRLVIDQEYQGQPCDVMIALHARKSWPAILSYRRQQPNGPMVVALTGTDLYRDIRTSRRAQSSLALADCLVVLQVKGLDDLPRAHRDKARVIYQSAEPTRIPVSRSAAYFEVCVLGHLRHEKDPFRAALAVCRLPASSRVRVTHLGQALSPGMEERARTLMARDARYRWLGELPRGPARRILAGSRLLILSSRLEGGANVISEALADGVPVLASRIPGSVGMLGEDYPGFFPVGDTQALADLLRRCELDPEFYAKLKSCCHGLSDLVDPARERQAWQELLAELCADRR